MAGNKFNTWQWSERTIMSNAVKETLKSFLRGLYFNGQVVTQIKQGIKEIIVNFIHI